MQITYIYHSCFLVETERELVVFDYWKDPKGLLYQRLDGAQKPIYFVVSHFHEDHYNPEIFDYPATAWLLSNDTIKRRRVVPKEGLVRMLAGDVFDDGMVHFEAFRSTDVGISMALSLPDGTTIFHAGDLNNWYFPDRAEEHLKVSLKEMEGMYLSVLKSVKQRFPKVGHLMFPVDPRLGTECLRGVIQWLRSIEVQHLYPMHYWEEDLSEKIDALRLLFPEVEIHTASSILS